ncbi:MAG: hypothetical protein HOH48_09040 [Candidatus Puniceispirillum sp.]|jgi:lipopolysaccharide export system protein LptA|uniref:LptA/OstA family protein n=1 Tax=Candidatus Puniceispirillum sp. TaxID=2026719 RepID=UPI001EBD21B0|nr:hypothetical protein [Candidatus Puniceispirillum sp.]MBT6414653.1 hypothetical protein [Candidatus Puniceispirillum sp.]MBT6566118.1 hypothetical protein [Candidatus Puniceispirillum sp.]
MKVLKILSRNLALFALPLAINVGMTMTANAADKQADTQNAPVTIEASDFLEWDQNKGLYLAKGNAIATQLDMRISADRLEASYDPASDGREINVMTAIGNVSFIDGDNTAMGTRLVYDLQSSIYSVFGKNAKVTSPNGIMTATKKITYDESNPAKAKITGIGKANYTANDGRIVAGDEIIAFTNEAGDLQTLDATGNAYVRTVDNQTATGDKVNYDFNTSIAILTGNVELIEGQNIMRGSRAEVDFNSGISRLLSDGQGGRVTGIMVQ